jgi:hypothetical protein
MLLFFLFHILDQIWLNYPMDDCLCNYITKFGGKKRKEKCKFKSKLPWLTITWKGELELTLTKEVLNYNSFVVEVESICFFLWVI